MTPENDDKQPTLLSQAEFQELLHEKMRQAVRVTLINILEEEVESFVNAPRYQRTACSNTALKYLPRLSEFVILALISSLCSVPVWLVFNGEGAHRHLTP